MLYFNSIVRGMSVPHTPLTHIPNNYYSRQQLLSNRLDCACTFSPPTIPKSTLSFSADAEHHNVEQDSFDYLNNVDSLKSLDKERMRRMRIGLANKGRVPWNKGRQHTAETRERISMRTLEALKDPKVRKKMAEHPRCHSDQIKEKISYSLRRAWEERLKSKRAGEQFFLLWEQNIANAAKKGGSGQDELDWDSYDKIKEQIEFHQILQAEEREKEKLMAIVGANKLFHLWMEIIAKAAKKGGSGEEELDWDSYEKIKEEMILLNQLQRVTEKAKAKEMAKIKAEKEAQIKAIKKVMLTQKRKDLRERTKASKNIKNQPYKNAEEDKCAEDVTQEFKLGSKLTKNHVNNIIRSEVAREGDVIYSNFPTHGKLDLELIRREKMQKKVSLADQIQAAKVIKGKLH